MIDPEKILKTQKWLSDSEIFKLLSNVEYIIMAQPNLDDKAHARIRFTLFLNTQDTLPDEIVSQILEKFCTENKLGDVTEFKAFLADVVFAQTEQPTPMPHYIEDKEKEQIEEAGSIKNLIFDFKANAVKGYEKTKEGLTGWSYIYND